MVSCLLLFSFSEISMWIKTSFSFYAIFYFNSSSWSSSNSFINFVKVYRLVYGSFSVISLCITSSLSMFFVSTSSPSTPISFLSFKIFCFYQPDSYSHNIPPQLWMCHLRIHLLPPYMYSDFSVSCSVISLCITSLFSVSIEISLTSLFSFVSFFSA